ncbi:extensin isoform X2 [Drosophila hydei]|uniref:Extensin isoform X2 n=1 Tax=Drosophila hydei TaxID=7224 RepID=A0A6J1M9V6_DROHY|nr:extensin isoform X2 [Drosophila hydei]XP_023178130.2 extensin isoform X2 [Drosophila hydei]
MESALDVLSRAATMVQNNSSDTRLTSKELPTNKWRRERRQRAAAAEYQVHDSNSDREREREPDMDSPIDMSVTSNTVKHQRASPPPPYREPLGGGVNSHCYAASRPSVITQAPPKREQPKHAHHSQHHHHHSHSNHEHDHRSRESDSICDIDEHFRRSLGPGYAALLKSPTSSSPTPSPQPQQAQAQTQLQSVVGNGTSMQQVSPQAYRQQPTTTTYENQSQLPLSLPLSKLGLPIVHSPTLQSAPISPQHELPPPQKEPLSLSPPPVRSASALSCSPPPLVGVSQILDAPVTKREKALDTPHHTPPRCNTPPPAYASVMVSTPTMPAIIRVKAEPGLAAASSTHTPPASPTSSTNISIFTKTEASVDDHFAKALGDTWKKLQAHKE